MRDDCFIADLRVERLEGFLMPSSSAAMAMQSLRLCERMKAACNAMFRSSMA